ncbi:TIGR03643 family protein [Vreelandella nigrificans]|uniref:TIGR03643 family protein n=1 Tax=Vreelandella nigrificans TaxID=2042704 RepID=A0A2A4HR33_9GAMM|nr:TIGR03643 family protein [Halomonas nigrificans]PCF96859.1 TIGR03643 family protein [Halomonas nigrificans]
MPKAIVERFRHLPDDEQSRIIEMAWEDRTPFEAIETLFGLAEPDVIEVMRNQLKPASFRLWRKRVTGRATKHTSLRSTDVIRGYCPTQYKR